MRGVAYDTRRGNLMKLDFLHNCEPGNAFFGRRRLSEAEIVAAYGSSIISSSELSSFRPMVDLFCLPETCLISDVIQHFVDRGMPFHPVRPLCVDGGALRCSLLTPGPGHSFRRGTCTAT